MYLVVIVLIFFTARGQYTDKIEETTIDLCTNGTEESCEYFNSSELSTLPITVEVTTSVVSRKAPITKKPKTTTAKSVAKNISQQNGSSTLQPQPECTCDLTRGDCEVNCCCDVDCNEAQRGVFTRCVTLPLRVDTDYCVPPHLLYHNNSDYQTVQTDGGMLCVVRQNIHATTDYKDVPVVRTLTAIKKKLEKHKQFAWPRRTHIHPVFDSDIPYGEGSPVWISENFIIKHLAIPAAGGYTTQCLSSLIPKYLVEVDTSCTLLLRNKMDCLTSSFANFTVISSPRNFNFTGPQECTDDVCLSIRQFDCSKTCVEKKITPTSYNDSNKLCKNVVKSVHYELYHNGTQGIVKVKAFYTLGDFVVHDQQLTRKHHKITYKWAGSTSEHMLKRSGHPGYERGRPIISGRKVAKNVIFNTSETEWISLGVAGSSRHCITRYNLMFKENLKSQCIVKVNGTCKQIQQQIWQQMLGPSANLSETVISAYGDPRLEDVEAWVPLLTSDLPPAPTLVSAINIVVLYTRVGDVARPQDKIIGVFLDPLPSEVTCMSNLTQVMIEVSVKFVDKTVPPVTMFAPPPVYEIKLPQDFFYPFLSSGSNSCFMEKPVVVASVFVTFFLELALLYKFECVKV